MQVLNKTRKITENCVNFQESRIQNPSWNIQSATNRIDDRMRISRERLQDDTPLL